MRRKLLKTTWIMRRSCGEFLAIRSSACSLAGARAGKSSV